MHASKRCKKNYHNYINADIERILGTENAKDVLSSAEHLGQRNVPWTVEEKFDENSHECIYYVTPKGGEPIEILSYTFLK